MTRPASHGDTRAPGIRHDPLRRSLHRLHRDLGSGKKGVGGQPELVEGVVAQRVRRHPDQPYGGPRLGGHRTRDGHGPARERRSIQRDDDLHGSPFRFAADDMSAVPGLLVPVDHRYPTEANVASGR
jgi:hypothetical protein